MNQIKTQLDIFAKERIGKLVEIAKPFRINYLRLTNLLRSLAIQSFSVKCLVVYQTNTILCCLLLLIPAFLPAQTTKMLSIGDTLQLTGELLYEDRFDEDLQDWQVEQQPGGSVTVEQGTLDIDDAAGCTLWFKKKMSRPVLIEYTATVIDSGGVHDRVSDLNCFWLAEDPQYPAFFDNPDRKGRFGQYNPLRLYYVGLGGHNNTKTRFRRYLGNGEKPLLPEHDLSDPAYLITPNHPNRIRIIAYNGIIQYWRNDQLIFDFYDESPYTSGYFGFRTVNNHLRVDDFRVYALQKAAPSEE